MSTWFARHALLPDGLAADVRFEVTDGRFATIDVDAEGKTASPTFSVRPPTLGCTISAGGELTPGTTPGTVTVRAGDLTNFDETTVTLTAQPTTANPNPNPPSNPNPNPPSNPNPPRRP